MRRYRITGVLSPSPASLLPLCLTLRKQGVSQVQAYIYSYTTLVPCIPPLFPCRVHRVWHHTSLAVAQFQSVGHVPGTHLGPVLSTSDGSDYM